MVIPAVCIQLQNQRAFSFLGKVYFYLTLVEMTSLSPPCTCIIRQLRCFMIVLLGFSFRVVFFFFFFLRSELSLDLRSSTTLKEQVSAGKTIIA